jgi:thiamine pyrophosphokinase
VAFPAEKDETDLELALKRAREAGAKSVVVTAAASGRLDHTLGVIGAMMGAIDLAPRLVEPEMTAWFLGDAGCRELSVGSPGATISLISWDGTCSVSASGVRWPLKSHPLSADSGLGISNVVTAEKAHIEVHSGRLLVILPSDRDASALLGD